MLISKLTVGNGDGSGSWHITGIYGVAEDRDLEIDV